VAQFRLEVQAIKRSEGRSAVAAAAYRSASRLKDDRLEMVFDYAAKGGVMASGVMAPEDAPPAFLDRETLWNAAEAADRRSDSRTAREVLVSLPHELDDAQRHALLRAFVAEGLVAQGMIADYAIHQPDAHGDARNHHAHVMITTRHVGAEGFGFKGRAWDNPEAVRGLRTLWADLQNQHLRAHLGPNAPQVTHLSLAGQGTEREATVHLGPAASGMERRGETSDRGETNRKIADRNAEREATPGAIRDLEDRLSAGQPRRDYPIGAVIREFEAIHHMMVAERLGWVRALGDLATPEPPRARGIVREVLGDTGERRAEAARRLAWTEARVRAGRARRAGLVRWVTQPARMIWAKHAELNRLERVRRAARQTEQAFRVRRDWLVSDAGRTYVAARLHPAQQAQDAARRAGRTLERKIKRADRRIENVARTRTKLLVAQALGHTTLTAPSQLRVGVGQAVREVDRRVVDALGRFTASQQQSALTRVLRVAQGRNPTIDR
jgi:hypothetical protein